mgnify:CR=1 FL=1
MIVLFLKSRITILELPHAIAAILSLISIERILSLEIFSICSVFKLVKFVKEILPSALTAIKYYSNSLKSNILSV